MQAAGDDRRSFGRWVAGVQRRAVVVLLGAALVAALAGRYTANHLSVDTDTRHLLSPTLPWRVAEAAMSRRFPQLDHSLAVVVDAPTPELADVAQRRLAAMLQARSDAFRSVFAAEVDPYFRREGLLYLPVETLDALAQQLNLAQPFLGTLARDPSLRGLASLLLPALQRPAAVPFDLGPALGALATGVGAAADGREQAMDWQGLTGGGAGVLPSAGRRRFIELDPKLDFARLMPAAAPMAAAREAIAQLRGELADRPGAAQLQLRLTGSVALEHEELLSAFGGVGVATAVALVLVAVLLGLALRSLPMVLAAVITLVYGLLLTATFAAAAVGHLNLISIAFGLLYVGLGIDYALYLCMQVREQRALGADPATALPRAAGEVGGFMLVCALTTSIGFLAFIPTSFDGVAELGLIAAVGMFVSLAVSLTLLPALLAVLPATRVPAPRPPGALLQRLSAAPYRHARVIRVAALVVGLVAAAIASRARFDFDPLDLRDPKSESVSTFRDLLRDPALPPLTLAVLAPDDAHAAALTARLAALPQVARAFSLADLVPADQDAKLEILSDLQLSLDLPPAQPTTAGVADERAAATALATALESAAAGSPHPAAQQLATQLRRLVQAADGAAAEATIARVHANLFGALPAQLDQLREALPATPTTAADLPPLLRARFVAADGTRRVEIWPRAVLDQPAAIAQFVDAVRAVAPDAVGAPVAFLEAGRTVVDAFRQAFAYAVVAVLLLLRVLLRSLADTLRVVGPLLLAGVCTVALMVLLGQRFNFANVIALPLVLGVGVDYGVYLVQRSRTTKPGENLLQTSTARAVWFGALITIANFGNLMLAPHPGMASMGLLLTLGLTTTLVCTLVVLPSLLAPGRASADRP